MERDPRGACPLFLITDPDQSDPLARPATVQLSDLTSCGSPGLVAIFCALCCPRTLVCVVRCERALPSHLCAIDTTCDRRERRVHVRVLMDTRRGERTFAARRASASPLPPAGRRATRGGATRRRCGAARWSSSSRSRQSPRRARPSSCRTRSIGSSRSGGRASSPPARGKPVGVGGRVVKRSVAPTHLLHRLVGRRKGEVESRVTRTERASTTS